MKSRSPRRAASSAIASSSAGAAWPAVAYAHAVFESACGVKSRSPRPAASLAPQVVPALADALRTHEAVSALYDVSPNAIGSYGCLLLARRALRPHFV